MLKIFEKIFGSKHEKDIKKIQPLISSINELQISLVSLSDDQLRQKGLELKQKVRNVLEPMEQEKKTLSLKLDNMKRQLLQRLRISCLKRLPL